MRRRFVTRGPMMKKDFNKRFIRNVLIEMERMLSNLEPIYKRHYIYDFGPIYENEMRLEKDGPYSEDFMITYAHGYFTISFSFASDPSVIALVMQKLSQKFNLEIGAPFYASCSDKAIYWGSEGDEKYWADLKEALMKETVMKTGTPPFVEKEDANLRN